MNRVARTLLATAASLMSGQALAQEELPFVRTDAESLEHARSEHARSWCGKLNENTSLNCDDWEPSYHKRLMRGQHRPRLPAH